MTEADILARLRASGYWLTAPTEPLNDAVRGMGFNADSLRVTLTAHCAHECPRKEK